jgi:hypothetical protein
MGGIIAVKRYDLTFSGPNKNFCIFLAMGVNPYG